MKRTPLELADLAMVEIAQDVTRNVANDQPDDSVIDPAFTCVDRRDDGFAELRGGESFASYLGNVDYASRKRYRMKAMLARSEIVLDEPLARNVFRALVIHLAPHIGARVLDRARVERVRRDLVIDVIMTQRNIVPLLGAKLAEGKIGYRPLDERPEPVDDSLDLIVHEENVVPNRWIRLESRARPHSIRNREDMQIVLGKPDAFRLGIDDSYSKRREKSKQAARFRRSRRIVIPGYHHDDGVRQHLHEPRKMRICGQDRGIRWTHRVKYIPRDDDDIRTKLDHGIDRLAECRCDIGFALIEAVSRLALVLAESKMEIREMDELHRAIPAFRC